MTNPPQCQSTFCRTKTTTKQTTGTTQGHKWPVLCKRQCLHALTSPSPNSRFQQPNWLPENSRWYGFAKWQTLSSASKVNYWNIDTWSTVPRHGPHGPILTATSLDGWHKECWAKWLEWTQFCSSQRTRYCKQGQRMSRTASSPASSGRRNQWAKPNMIGSRGRQGTLPFRCRHTLRQLTYHQTPHWQRDLHNRGKILHDGRQKNLPMYTHDEVWVHVIDRNCDLLPLSLEDLFNYTTLILKFCTIKPIWALLLRQVFFWGGKGAFRPKKGCNAPSAGYVFSRKKIFQKLNTYCKLL